MTLILSLAVAWLALEAVFVMFWMWLHGWRRT
jgi:hypothetical protein